jgi:hypothetical protein
MWRGEKIIFTSGQFKILAEFFSDLAKGLFLAAIIGQGFVVELQGLARLTSLITWIIIACFSLVFSLYFTRESE